MDSGKRASLLTGAAALAGAIGMTQPQTTRTSDVLLPQATLCFRAAWPVLALHQLALDQRCWCVWTTRNGRMPVIGFLCYLARR